MFSSEDKEALRVSRDVVAGCKRHDLGAFERLYQQYSGRLYNVAYRMAGNAADADELLQEIFLQVYRRIDTFRGESSLGTWLYRLATNHCLDYIRSKQGRQAQATDSLDEVDGFEPVAPASWRPDAALDRLDLERAIAQLPPSYRAAFVLHDIEGFDHGEVGRQLGIAEGTSKSLLHKARLRLRKLLRGEGASPRAGHPEMAGSSGLGLVEK
jgi:RNA polymerase sigma-70 factor (ECF subfamily)